ncbi:hypothetical protein ACJX0J_025239, partial [Zea mays]
CVEWGQLHLNAMFTKGGDMILTNEEYALLTLESLLGLVLLMLSWIWNSLLFTLELRYSPFHKTKIEKQVTALLEATFNRKSHSFYLIDLDQGGSRLNSFQT